MSHIIPKPVLVTKQDEIASIIRNEHGDIMGEHRYDHEGRLFYVADRESLNEWRERQAKKE